MAFAGAAVPVAIGGGDNILEITGLTLLANAGVFGVGAVDSGRLTTDNTTTPVNETAISPTWGPGEGNWTAADAAAVTVHAWDSALATGTPVQLAKTIVGGNLNIDIHSLGAGAVAALTLRLIFEHSLAR